MGRLRTLDDLAAALGGAPRPGCDWSAVLALANQSLVTPQLAAAVRHGALQPPPEAARFLDEVLSRNRERNRRLWRQLMDALDALGAAGITPTALKGAALWLWSGGPRDRLMSDLDLLVQPGEAETAIEALTSAGFGLAQRRPGPLVHVVAELGRPQDAGLIDLHQRPPGPPGLVAAVDFGSRCGEREVEGRRVRVPDAAVQLLHLMLHDQFHDGDFWRGGFDLRHHLDTVRLASDLDAADEAWLAGACGTPLSRTALAAQRLSARRLTGQGQQPPAATRAARWTVSRWRLQFACPALRLPLACAAVLAAWPQVREHRRAERLALRRFLPADDAGERRPPERLSRLGEILRARPGKT
jgi:hypothetical protein